jgi:hypothetical protein
MAGLPCRNDRTSRAVSTTLIVCLVDGLALDRLV